MAFRDLLAQMSGMRVINEDVPLEYEVSRILSQDQELPVSFTNLSGMRAAGNVWSDRGRIAEALGTTKENLVRYILDAMASPQETTLASDVPFRDQVLTEFDLTKLPIPKYFPNDAGRYITSAVAAAEYEGKKNVSFHRMMLYDKSSFALRLVPRHLYTTVSYTHLTLPTIRLV